MGSLKLLKFLKLETIAKLLNCKMMDRQQITLLVTLNGFCPFRKKAHPLVLTNMIRLDGVPTHIFYIVFQVLKVVLIKNYTDR